MTEVLTFESHPHIEHKTNNLDELEDLTKELVGTLKPSELTGYGVEPILLVTDPKENYHASLHKKIFATLQGSIGGEDPPKLTYARLWYVSNAEEFRRHSKRNRSLPQLNFHTDYGRIIEKGKVTLGDMGVATMLLLMEGNGTRILSGEVVADKKKCKKIETGKLDISPEALRRMIVDIPGQVIGYQNAFVRGPVEEEPLQGNYEELIVKLRTWSEVDSTTIHAITDDITDDRSMYVAGLE